MEEHEHGPDALGDDLPPGSDETPDDGPQADSGEQDAPGTPPDGEAETPVLPAVSFVFSEQGWQDFQANVADGEVKPRRPDIAVPRPAPSKLVVPGG